MHRDARSAGSSAPRPTRRRSENQPDDINHGLLTYPVLQAADIIIYKASLVPVGRDQAAHLELSREIVRAFNARYGDTFPEPQAVFTDAPTVLGTDGVRKMSKSVGNTIDIFAAPEVVRKQVMSMVTDTKRILRTDPGRPEVCNVCQLHRSFLLRRRRHLASHQLVAPLICGRRRISSQVEL